MKKLYRGKYGSGHSAVALSRLMGCSRATALEYLYGLKAYLGRLPNDEELGQMIQQYRNKKDVRKINKWLS